MSIQSEITRLSGNVSDALAAIESKGVTIPSGSNSDDLATLIGQIQTGGGGSAVTVIETPDSSGGTIKNIVGVDISSDTVTAAAMLSGYTAHNSSGTAITGTIQSQAAQTITPTTTNQTIASGKYLSGAQTILGDANLIAGNIKDGVPIFGVTGSYTGGGGNTFVVTVSYNDQTNMWEPDCTFQDLLDADSNNKEVLFKINEQDGGYEVAIGNNSGGGQGIITEWYYSVYSNYAEHVYVYIFNSSGITLDGDWDVIDPYFQTVTKTYTPTESTQTETVTYNSDYYNGLQSVNVTVNPISSSYVGSGITRRDSTDLSASGATVTVPSGYYAAQASKAVDSMTLPTSATSSATSGYTSKATISRSTSDQYINIPTGYNTSGAYYKVNAVPNGTVTAPSTISGTSATVSAGTNTLTLSKTVSVTPSVTTAGYVSSGTAGNASVSLTASITTKAAATYNTSTSDQTISASQYLTGAQTIKAVTYSGLSADKILSGTTVKIGDENDDDRIASVSGSVVIQHYYTGSSTPSSSLGENGDIYLKTS